MIVQNGGYQYPDYDPSGMGLDDHEVKAYTADVTHGPLEDKLESTDGTVGIVADTITKKVNLSSLGLGDHKVKRDADATPVYGDELLISVNGSISQNNDPESDSINVQVVCSSDTPLPDDAIGSAGDPSDQPSSKTHVHPVKPVVALTKRYYLTGNPSDLPRIAGSEPETGYLLSTTNPSDEAHATDVGPPGTSPLYIWFDAPVGEPGLTNWPSGVATANLRVRVRNTHEGLTYKLYSGEGIVYEAVLIAGGGGYLYQTAPYATAPTLSSSYQTCNFPIYLRELTVTSSVRLRADLILQVTGGSLTDEVFEVRCGGDNASYFDSLFTNPSGGTADHQALYDRGTFLVAGDEATYGHPMSYIEPGWLQTPTTQGTVVGGLLALASATPPVTSNSVTVVGYGPLVGIETTGKNNGDELTLFFLSAMTVTNNGTTGDAAYAPIAFGTMGLGTPPQDLAVTQYSCLKIGWYGGVWRPVAPWFICEAT